MRRIVYVDAACAGQDLEVTVVGFDAHERDEMKLACFTFLALDTETGRERVTELDGTFTPAAHSPPTSGTLAAKCLRQGRLLVDLLSGPR